MCKTDGYFPPYTSCCFARNFPFWKILFDTGSSDTWVPGVGCTSCGLHSAFNDLASSTAVPMGRNFSNR